MSWFDEQIKNRKIKDEAEFENAFIDIAETVIGSKVTAAFKDKKRIASDAIDEILKFYHIAPVEVPEKISNLDDQLEYVLRPHSIMRREVILDDNWYKNAFGAMLGVRISDGNVVALIPSSINGYYYYDAVHKEKIKINETNYKDFENEAIAFYTTFPLKELGLKDIISYGLKTFVFFDYLMIAITALIVSCIGLLIPKVNRILFSDVVYSGQMKYLISIATFLICVSISKLIFTIVQNLVSSRISIKMNVMVESAMMIRLLSLLASFFKQFSAGDLSMRIEYLGVLCELMINVFLKTGLTAIFSLVYIIQIFNYTPSLAIPSIIIVVLSLSVSVISTFLEMKVNRIRLERSAKVSGLDFSLITGIQKIRLSGAEKRAFAKWGNLYSKLADVTYNYPLFIKIVPVIQNAITLIGTYVLFNIALNSNVNVADYYAFNAAYATMSAAFITLANMTTSISQIKPILEMLTPILEAVPEIDENKQVISKLSGGVEINNVYFRYTDNMPYVVNGLSLKIKSGEYVAIVGKTGCGKSTLMRLLLGFEKAERGGIFYDGKDINTIDLKSLRRSIGTVMQDGKLFEGDIFSNISIAAPQLTLDEAWEAASLAGIAESIEKMPMGMFTYISEGGQGISGGQRQRLMIARAIAPKPKILMFDEATSALDNITQKIVTESLNSLKCTRIVIAHRLSTIKDCDRIIVMENGNIIEEGTYDKLIEQNGYFAELVKRQRVDEQ